MKKSLLFLLLLAPVVSLRAASLVDLGYGSSSQTGVVNQAAIQAGFSEGSVTVHYAGKTHLASFIPATLSVTVTAYHDGEVDFDYPWYGFLADKSELESQVRATVADVLTAVPSGGWTDDDRVNLALHIAAALDQSNPL